MTAVDVATRVRTPSNGQRLFLGYTLFILVDLTVLNFFIVTETILSKIYALLADEPISH